MKRRLCIIIPVGLLLLTTLIASLMLSLDNAELGLFNWLQTSEGQMLVDHEGYVALGY